MKKTPVFISRCCCNKLPETSGIKATQVYHLISLEIRSPIMDPIGLKARCQEACVYSGDPGEESIPCLLWLQETTSIIWLMVLSSSVILLLPSSHLLF